MKYLNWNNQKNEILKNYRSSTFEIVSHLIETRQTLDIVDHPNRKKYPNQNIFVIEYRNYAYLSPFVEDEKQIFLKTIIPSRKATQKYLRSKTYG